MEGTPLQFEVPTGARPGQFCVNHIVTRENPDGTDCTIWLIENKGTGACPYVSPEHAQQGTVSLGKEPQPGADGVCRDFEPRNFGPDSDFPQRQA